MTEPLLDASLVQSIGWALVHFVWQGTVIGACTALTLRVLAERRSSTRYLVACVGLALMLVVPVTAVFNSRPIEPLGVLLAGATTADVVPTVPVDRLLPGAVLVWLVGVALLSLRLIAACVGVERLKRATRDVDETVSTRVRALADRLGVARSIRVFESTMVRVPTVVGYLRPVILLPVSVIAGLPPAHLDAVLAHELAHVRRHDYLVNVLQSVVETLLFYHPAVWWCSRQVRIEREHCCDDVVVEACGDRVAYATALAQLEELRGLNPMLSLNATGGRLIDRVRRLLGESPMKERRSTMWTIAAALAVVMAIVVTPALTVADASELVTSLPSDSVQLSPAQVPVVPSAVRDRKTFKVAEQAKPLAQSAPQPQAEPTPPPQAEPLRQPPLPPVPPIPGAVDVRPVPRWAPAAPVPPLPPNSQALPALPARPASPAPPAPPAPPLETLGLDPDSIHELVTSATQEIAESLKELRRVTEEVGLKQEAIRLAQAEMAKMRIESLATNTQIEAMQKALSDFSAKSAASQFDRREMQKLIDELNAELTKLRVR